MSLTAEQVKGRIKSLAKKNDADARVLIRIYMMERFLERVAGRNHVDNRIFFKIGNAVNDLGLVPESECVIALAMSSSSKNSFFDRFEKLEGAELQRK
ncbi:MAG: hypothetical protein KBS83_04490 [Lachnospiraceae bacterium]|nr:hypothetical protein [Candidatus Equihabitans merdae]